MIIINLYEIIINLLALGTALVLIPTGIFLWILLGTFLYNQIRGFYGSRNKRTTRRSE